MSVNLTAPSDARDGVFDSLFFPSYATITTHDDHDLLFHMIPWVRRTLAFVNALLRLPRIRRVASAKLPTDYGEFAIPVFKNTFSGETHVALVRGEIGDGE